MPRSWTNVKGNLFNETGKWKYEVNLDYSEFVTATHYVNQNDAARMALAEATRLKTSGVTMSHIPVGWFLVVNKPPNGWPVMVIGVPGA